MPHRLTDIILIVTAANNCGGHDGGMKINF